VMVDGYHTAEQAQFDYLAFLPKLATNGVVIFHDTLRQRVSTFYGADRAYEHTVRSFIDRLRTAPGLEVMTLPFGEGATLVCGRPAAGAALDAAVS
jgi:predicted O-methyltransferase YrrM